MNIDCNRQINDIHIMNHVRSIREINFQNQRKTSMRKRKIQFYAEHDTDSLRQNTLKEYNFRRTEYY